MVGVVVGRTDVGRKNWSCSRDREGHRTYKLRLQVRTSSLSDGPATVLETPGLPLIGSIWNFGNDFDAYAYCTPEATVTPVVKNEANRWWFVDHTFSTNLGQRCQDNRIEDPLNEPEKLSGSFVKYKEEASRDRFGNAIKSSSHEMFRGPQVEFDNNRPTVVIEKNFSVLGLDTFAEMVDTVNDATLWGLAKRKIKLSNVSWTRKLFGTCNFYFTRRYEFDINFDTFDREVIDEGTKVLQDGGNKDDPRDFIRYKDQFGENNRVLLDGMGNALANGAAPINITVEKYDESNFLLLGIPTVLG